MNEGTPILTPEQQEELDNPTDLPQLLTREEQTEEPEAEVKDESETDAEDTGADDTDVDEPETPEPVQLPPDPGTYEPKDYSFQVTTYSEDGKRTTTHTIKSTEDWDKLLDEDPDFGSGTALMKAQRKATRMEMSLERDQQNHEKAVKEYEEAKASYEQEQTRLTTLASEMDYLVQKGKLPRVANQYKNADWSDPEIADKPGVKEQIALLSYMQKENKVRAKAKLAPMTSILDAYNAYQADEKEQQALKDKKTAGEQRKRQGAKIAGTTPAPVSSTPPRGIMVGPKGSLRDLGRL